MRSGHLTFFYHVRPIGDNFNTVRQFASGRQAMKVPR